MEYKGEEAKDSYIISQGERKFTFDVATKKIVIETPEGKVTLTGTDINMLNHIVDCIVGWGEPNNWEIVK